MLEFYIREVKYFLFHWFKNMIYIALIIVLTYTYYLHKDIEFNTLLKTAKLLSENMALIVGIGAFTLLYQIYKQLRTYKFRQLPYSFQLLNRTNESSKKIYDNYKKKKKGFHIYTNKSHRIDFKHYQSEYENIKYFFKVKEIVIKRFLDGSVGIKLGERLSRIVNFQMEKIKENMLYFGEGEEEQPIYIPIDKIKHTLLAGETGGGKSNVMSVLMVSFIQGLLSGNIEKLVLIDLKGNEVSIFKPLKEVFKDRIVFAHTMEEVNQLLKDSEIEFQERKAKLDEEALSDIYELNEEEKKRVFGNIIFYIDELAQMTLKDDNLFKNDKHYKETYLEVQKGINRFLSLYRAMGMKMLLSTQSPRSEVITGLMKANVVNQVMLRVANKLNANIVMDSAKYEHLEPINISEFPSGRAIVSIEGMNDNKALLLQVPYIQKDVIKGYIKSLSTHKENR